MLWNIIQKIFPSFFQKYIFSHKKKETQVKEYYSKPEEMGQNVTTFIAQTQLPPCNFIMCLVNF